MKTYNLLKYYAYTLPFVTNLTEDSTVNQVKSYFASPDELKMNVDAKISNYIRTSFFDNRLELNSIKITGYAKVDSAINGFETIFTVDVITSVSGITSFTPIHNISVQSNKGYQYFEFSLNEYKCTGFNIAAGNTVSWVSNSGNTDYKISFKDVFVETNVCPSKTNFTPNSFDYMHELGLGTENVQVTSASSMFVENGVLENKLYIGAAGVYGRQTLTTNIKNEKFERTANAGVFSDWVKIVEKKPVGFTFLFGSDGSLTCTAKTTPTAPTTTITSTQVQIQFSPAFVNNNMIAIAQVAAGSDSLYYCSARTETANSVNIEFRKHSDNSVVDPSIIKGTYFKLIMIGL